MEEQTITITLEEYKELRAICEALKELQGDYKYLYHIYKEQLKILEQYEEYLYGAEKEEEIKKNPIGFKTK
ncbi:MAG: hypothetical protein GX241_07910 [Ruminococcaceae bacterium]|nr:hypothetical protein [Oscillospiraceae bacterium]